MPEVSLLLAASSGGEGAAQRKFSRVQRSSRKRSFSAPPLLATPVAVASLRALLQAQREVYSVDDADDDGLPSD